MPYHVTRDGQVYGPYTLEDLQRYVASGNIQATDLAKNEDLPDWVPVSQILGTNIPVFAAPQPVLPAFPNLLSPPDLAWGLVILFSCLTCGIFPIVWNLILASWFNKLEPKRNILNFYVIATGLLIVQTVLGPYWVRSHHLTGYHFNFFDLMWSAGFPIWFNLLKVAAWLTRLFARFSLRAALNEHYATTEPLGIRFNGVLVFFFGCFYFQYKMNQINEAKRALYRQGAVQF